MDHVTASHRHIAEMLANLLSEAGHVVLLSYQDGIYSGSSSGPTKHSIAMTLEGCVEGLTPNPRMKICLREDCVSKGVPKFLWNFGPDKDAADGHSSVCHACENKRVSKWQKERKRKKKEAEAEQADQSKQEPINEQGT